MAHVIPKIAMDLYPPPKLMIPSLCLKTLTGVF